ncbi:MAG: RNA polymerase sigma factor [Caldisericia bacterium]|jgi:RNA polymerase sigma-70 factor (ECF subfamily)|nr:RNA polymerase sigma factor [Caldisericia bacterium]
MFDREKEKELIERAKFDKSAFGILFEEYFYDVLNYIYRRIGSKEDAKDLTQEVFTRALLSLDKYRDIGKPYLFFLLKISTNVVNDFIKRKGKLLLKEDVDSEEKIDFLNSISYEKKFFLLQKSILKLPIKYQTVISLRFLENKKISEISEILNMNENSVKTLIRRGLMKLRDIIKEDETFLKDISL